MNGLTIGSQSEPRSECPTQLIAVQTNIDKLLRREVFVQTVLMFSVPIRAIRRTPTHKQTRERVSAWNGFIDHLTFAQTLGAEFLKYGPVLFPMQRATTNAELRRSS